MPALADIQAMTPTELRVLAKAQIEEVVKAIYEGQTYQIWVAREQDKNGDWLKRAWNVHNAYDGNIVSLHEVTWTYWKPGVVKDIDVREGNRVKRISHSPEGQVVGVQNFTV